MSISCNQVISLTSDEEEPPRKRIKPITLSSCKSPTATVIISSDDTSSSNVEETTDLLQGSAVSEVPIKPQVVPQTTDSTCEDDDPQPQTAGESKGLGIISEPTPTDHLETYLKTCTASIENSKYDSLKDKFSIIRKLYDKYLLKKDYDEDIKEFLDEQILKASQSSADAVLTFDKVLSYFSKSPVEVEEGISPEHCKKIKLLLKTCLKLIQKIRKLECAEVDWDDDNDSAYIKEDRYKQRLTKVFTQYCKYANMNPYAGRLTHKKFQFLSSRYPQINQAINKKYQSCRSFPTYKSTEKIVRDCVDNHRLSLSEAAIKRESEVCFKELGEFLQKRRKQELYENHYYFIRDSNDPAQLDDGLDKCLKENFQEGMRKIESICEKFVQEQMKIKEVGTEEQSEDSDDSEYVDSDPDDTS